MHVIREAGRSAVECPSCQHRFYLTTPKHYSVRAPRDVFDNMGLTLSALEREEMHVLLLNAKNNVMRDVTVYQGNVSAALVRIAELFTEAVKQHAAGLILVHNHPSGDPEPSADDLHLTAEAIAGGRLLDMPVLDHIVIGADSYVSLRDRGVLFEARATASAAGEANPLAGWSYVLPKSYDSALPQAWVDKVYALTGKWAPHEGIVWSYDDRPDGTSTLFGYPAARTEAGAALLASLPEDLR
jgi:hypothetical protein